MGIEIKVRHRLELFVREAAEIAPKVQEAARRSLEANMPYVQGTIEKNMPPETEKLAASMSTRTDVLAPDTTKGQVLTTAPVEAWMVLEYGAEAQTKTFDRPVPIKKAEGEGPDKPLESMSPRERAAWEQDRVVFTRKIVTKAKQPTYLIHRSMEEAFPELVNRLKNRLLNTFTGREITPA